MPAVRSASEAQRAGAPPGAVEGRGPSAAASAAWAEGGCDCGCGCGSSNDNRSRVAGVGAVCWAASAQSSSPLELPRRGSAQTAATPGRWRADAAVAEQAREREWLFAGAPLVLALGSGVRCDAPAAEAQRRHRWRHPDARERLAEICRLARLLRGAAPGGGRAGGGGGGLLLPFPEHEEPSLGRRFQRLARREPPGRFRFRRRRRGRSLDGRGDRGRRGARGVRRGRAAAGARGWCLWR
mmetsp:Transcript_77684/g.218020  ORF Transcript_77684/g.218020 Transcript_77684/m.218020 type:complete len:240 (+) Transcript_77684:673-1392(+)